jgi:hypothetical protein
MSREPTVAELVVSANAIVGGEDELEPGPDGRVDAGDLERVLARVERAAEEAHDRGDATADTRAGMLTATAAIRREMGQRS